MTETPAQALPAVPYAERLFDVYVGWKETKEVSTPMVQTVPAGSQPDLDSMDFICAKTYVGAELGKAQSDLATLAAKMPSRETWRSETRSLFGLQEASD